MIGIDELSQFTGSETFYQHKMFHLSVKLTEGCHFVRSNHSAYWLFDLICSYQPQLQDEPFQVWQLTKQGEDACTIVCTDGNSNHLISQYIPFTDFPFDITIWLVGGICLLPSEY